MALVELKQHHARLQDGRKETATLKKQLFANTGLRVSRFCLGTMTFGTAWGFGADKAECEQVFQAYLDAGGNFIDTANVYTNGESEEMLV